MSFLAKLFGYLRLPKITIVSKILLASFVVLFIFGFTEYDPDNLYSYQWGLKNNGNFMVGNAFLRNNHKASYFDKTTNDTRFFDRRDIVDYLISHGLAQDSMKAMENFDIKWDMGYEFFKSIVGGRKSIIALIDTGVDITHFELIDSIWINENEIRDNGVDDDRNGYIDDVCGYNFNGKNNNVMPENQSEVHGTHAAGIMVAKHNNMGTKGIAFDENIKLMPLKVLDSNENGYMS
ncbi:MAG: S8 family serine peptidase, partial [Lachnospiraceae bacterium]|nr:S8 family serine peptidase [Lachnospiraceae bacterium]